jgi:ferritin-like metal-binding protein YciE
MAMDSMHELFEHELKDMYYAEKRLAVATNKLANEVSTQELRSLFKQHNKETKEQIKRLEKVFKTLKKKPVGAVCPGINGLLKEHQEFAKEKAKDEIQNFYDIGAAMKAEAYEINAYEHMIQLARELGMHTTADLLSYNLAEEQNMFNMLKSMRADYSTSAILDEIADYTAAVTGQA